MQAEFLIVSDLHVDEYDRFAKIITDPQYGTINSRLFWCLDIFEQIRKYGEKVSCKTLLIGGDLFDKRGSLSVRTYNEVFLKLAALVEEEWEIFAVVGNHDQALKSNEIHALQCLPIAFAETDLLWQSRQGFTVGGVAFHERSSDFFHALKGISKAAPDVYLIHQGLRGAKIAGDEILSREDIALEDVRRFAGNAWIFSGHYHIHQKIDDRYYFIGSSTPKDFGDRTPKGFLHFKDGKIQQVESRAPKFVVVDAAELEARAQELKGHYVQVRYDGQAPEISLPDSESMLLVPKKVERDYQSRVDLSAENSPRMVFGKYLDSFNFDSEKRGRIQEALERILDGFQFAEKMGSAQVSFDEITFKNFLRYGETSIRLSKLEGLILIEGENLDDPSSVSNGSGKSSIFEGLRWALYGSTLRGLAGDEVVNSEGGADCVVEVSFRVEGQPYKVSRYRKHRKFKNQVMLSIWRGEGLSGEWADIRAKSDKDTTDLISRLIGADERVFDSIVFLGYGFNTSFAGLTDKEQKQVLENILGISYLSELLERAKAQGLRRREEGTDHSIQIGYLERQIEDKKVFLKGLLQRRQTSLYEERQKLEKEIASKKELLSVGDSTTEEARVRALRKRLAEISVQREELQTKTLDVAELEKELISVRKEGQKILRLKDEKVAALRADIRKATAGISDAQARTLQLLKSKKQGLCPTCKQQLASEELIDSEIEDAKLQGFTFQLAIDQIRGDLELATLERDAQIKSLEEVDEALDSTRDSLRDLQALQVEEAQTAKMLAEAESSLSRLKASVNAATAALERAETALRDLGKEDPYADLIAETNSDIEKIQLGLQERLSLRSQAIEAYEAINFWEIAFSDKGSQAQPPIKSFILESVVPVLDEFARRYSEILSSGALEVRFNTISRLKSGEFREQFSVEVSNRYGSLDYRGDSGGERRKVDIAIMFALHALSRLQTGTFFDLVCLDEVLDSLDKEGCDRVAELLRELTGEIERIFVITHNENLISKFGSRIKVVKKDGYSTIFDYTSLYN